MADIQLKDICLAIDKRNKTSQKPQHTKRHLAET